MAVINDDAWNFCYILPSINECTSIDDIELVVPNSLQMDWCKIPPFFCSGSETTRDIISNILPNNIPPCKFEDVMMRECTADDTHDAPDTIIKFLGVYVDDFIGSTNDLRNDNLCHLSRAMLHNIYSIFLPPSVTGHNGFDPIFEANIRKGRNHSASKKK